MVRRIKQAVQDADDVFSGNLRPVAILVGPGNPKRIRGFPPLLPPGVKNVLTRKGSTTALAKEFTEFLLSPAGSKIFAKWGWDARQ